MALSMGLLGAASFVAPAGSYDLLQTEILTASQASVTFSSLGDYAADYQHLQIRAVSKQDSTGYGGSSIRFNGDTATNYSSRFLRGSGSAVSSGASPSASSMVALLVRNSSADVYQPAVFDILDPFETTKYTTIRGLLGVPSTSGTFLELMSGSWRNTASLTSVTFLPSATSILSGSRFSLYGLRAS